MYLWIQTYNSRKKEKNILFTSSLHFSNPLLKFLSDLRNIEDFVPYLMSHYPTNIPKTMVMKEFERMRDEEDSFSIVSVYYNQCLAIASITT